MDGEPLLTLMHDLSHRDSLIYWLEYKDDDEFDTFRFGSIAGGSAMKFRIHQNKELDCPSNRQHLMSPN